jgi:hypothetical protein
VEQLKALLRKYESIDIANAHADTGDAGRGRNGNKEKAEEKHEDKEKDLSASHKSSPLRPAAESQLHAAIGTGIRTRTQDTYSSSAALNSPQRTLKSSEQEQEHDQEEQEGLCSSDDVCLGGDKCSLSKDTERESGVMEVNRLLQREIKALRARRSYDQKEERRAQLLERQESSKVTHSAPFTGP